MGRSATDRNGHCILVCVLNRVQSPGAVENVVYFIFLAWLLVLALVLRSAECEHSIDCRQ